MDSEQLSKKRRELGLTVEEVADGMSVSVRTIYNIEHGISPESSVLYYKLYLENLESRD